jgi:hypothetical protein
MTALLLLLLLSRNIRLDGIAFVTLLLVIITPLPIHLPRSNHHHHHHRRHHHHSTARQAP